MTVNTPSRRARTLLALVAVLSLVATSVDARPGRGSTSFGSRGARTYQAPPPTTTAPRQAAPVERSITQPSQVQPAARPGMSAPGGLFGRGFFGSILGGLIGAGIAGMLFGHGLFGGMTGFGSFIGLLLQIAVIVFLARWAIRAFRRRNQPAYAGAAQGLRFDRPPAGPSPRPGYGGAGLGGAAGGKLELTPADFEAFERLLGAVQEAWSRQDLDGLRRLTTPEMLSYLAQDLAEDASRGVANTVSDVRLLQGDLAEAWREGVAEYATVAMRFSLIDVTRDQATGQVVEGDPDRPVETTEIWTFLRTSGGSWLLSAIQQT